MNNYFQSNDRAEFLDLINRATRRYRGWNCITIRNGNSILTTENFLQGQVRTINNLNGVVLRLTNTINTQAATIFAQNQTITQQAANIAHLTAENATLRTGRDNALREVATMDTRIIAQNNEIAARDAKLELLGREIEALKIDLGVLSDNSANQQRTIDATCDFLERDDVRRALYRDPAVSGVEDFVHEVQEQASPDKTFRSPHEFSGSVPYQGDSADSPDDASEGTAEVQIDGLAPLGVAPAASAAQLVHGEADVTDNEWTEPAYSPIPLDKDADN